MALQLFDGKPSGAALERQRAIEAWHKENSHVFEALDRLHAILSEDISDLIGRMEVDEPPSVEKTSPPPPASTASSSKRTETDAERHARHKRERAAGLRK